MKVITKIVAVLALGAMLFSLAGCSLDIFNNDIAETVNGSVTMPEQYSIAYEVETAEGAVYTVKKVQDSDGNIYFKSGENEMLFIKGDKLYSLYVKDSDGKFISRDLADGYNMSYIDTATAEFATYAEQSKKQFIPGMKNDGEKEVLGRTCLVYSVSVGAENTGVTYTFLVDKETGICLGWEESKMVAGNELGSDGEIFECTEFITENVPSLKDLIKE